MVLVYFTRLIRLGDDVKTGISPPGVSFATMLGYGAGSAGTGIFSAVPNIILLFFLTNVLGIGPGTSAQIVLLPKLWVIFADPMAGYLSDRTQGRWGRRRPYLFWGAFLGPLMFVLLFSPPETLTGNWLSLYEGAAYFLFATCFTVYIIPYVAVPSEIATSAHELTRIMSIRIAFVLIGVLLAGASPILVDLLGGGRKGYVGMAIVIGCLCCIVMLIPFFALGRLRVQKIGTAAGGICEQAKVFGRNPPFMFLVLTYVFQIVGFGVMTSAMPYFVQSLWRSPVSMAGQLFLIMMIPGLCSIPVWALAARRLGNAIGLALASTVFICAAVIQFLMDAHAPGLAALLLVACLGMAFGGQQVLAFALASEMIQSMVKRSGQATEGAFTGVWMAGEKIGAAVGTAIVGGLLGLAGFVASTTGGAMQTPETIQMIRLSFTLIPAFLFIVSFAPLALAMKAFGSLTPVTGNPVAAQVLPSRDSF